LWRVVCVHAIGVPRLHLAQNYHPSTQKTGEASGVMLSICQFIGEAAASCPRHAKRTGDSRILP
jgi:hypothetical protein